MFFTSMLVLVEGLEDAAYICTYLVLADLWQEFRRLGGHIVPCQGKSSMILPLAIAKGLQIPTFVVFDADTDKCGTEDKKAKHEGDNRTLLKLCGLAGTAVLPDETIWSDALVMWKKDIGAAVAEDFGIAAWEALRNQTKAAHEIIDASDMYKCFSYIQWLLTDALDAGRGSLTLERLCKAIVKFGKATVAGEDVAAD